MSEENERRVIIQITDGYSGKRVDHNTRAAMVVSMGGEMPDGVTVPDGASVSRVFLVGKTSPPELLMSVASGLASLFYKLEDIAESHPGALESYEFFANVLEKEFEKMDEIQTEDVQEDAKIDEIFGKLKKRMSFRKGGKS